MRVKLKKQRNRVGFTLLELVIVSVIIAILASLGVASYRKVIVKAKAAKAKHAIRLIAEAEKIWQLDNGSYAAVASGSVDATIGTNKTGINLAVVDNDTNFNYSVIGVGPGTGTVCAVNSVVIGACGMGKAITLDLSTGKWVTDNCYD